jgi:DNA-dependent metalloprotease WSS1
MGRTTTCARSRREEATEQHHYRNARPGQVGRGKSRQFRIDTAGVGSPGALSKFTFPHDTLTHYNSLPPLPHTQAADMRAADEKRCASGSVAQQEAEKAARNSHRSNAIDLGDFDFSDDLVIFDEEPTGSKGPHTSTPRPADRQPSSHRSDQQASGSRPGGATQRAPPNVNVLTKPRPPRVNNASKPSAGSPWTCPTCTLINEPLVLQCDACLGARPREPQAHSTPAAAPAPAPGATAGWTCGVCGEQGMEHTFWTCRFCGSVKTESIHG